MGAARSLPPVERLARGRVTAFRAGWRVNLAAQQLEEADFAEQILATVARRA